MITSFCLYGIAVKINPRAFDRGEVAQLSAVRGLRGKKRVVDRPLDEIAAARLAAEPQQAVEDAKLVSGGAGFGEVEAPGNQVAHVHVVAVEPGAVEGEGGNELSAVIPDKAFYERPFAAGDRAAIRWDPADIRELS